MECERFENWSFEPDKARCLLFFKPVGDKFVKILRLLSAHSHWTNPDRTNFERVMYF